MNIDVGNMIDTMRAAAPEAFERIAAEIPKLLVFKLRVQRLGEQPGYVDIDKDSPGYRDYLNAVGDLQTQADVVQMLFMKELRELGIELAEAACDNATKTLVGLFLKFI